MAGSRCAYRRRGGGRGMSPMCAALFRPWAEATPSAAPADQPTRQPALPVPRTEDTEDTADTADTEDNADNSDTAASRTDTADAALSPQRPVGSGAPSARAGAARPAAWPCAGWLRPAAPSPPLVWSALQLLAEEESRKAANKRRRDKKFPCPKCHMTFSNKGQLTGHYRKHTGERPFECETCHKRFTRNEELTRHTRIHTGDRPFGCELCGKRFGRKDHLNKHQRTHAAPMYAAAALASVTSPMHAAAVTSQMHAVTSQMHAVTSQMHAVLAPYHPFGYGGDPRKLFQ